MLNVSVIDRPLGFAQSGVSAEDTDLVAAIRRGDSGSREALYHRYKRRVFALAVRIVGTWIYRLSVNAALSHRSRRGAVPGATSSDLEGPVAAALIEGPPTGDAVLRARLERALWQLPVGYRTVIVLHDVEGLEHEEVAQILGCHVGTSKSQLHKARGKLREILQQDGITSSELEER